MCFYLLITASCKAQHTFVRELPSYVCLALAGALKGQNEALWAYNPYNGNQFWDPYISWKNKENRRWVGREIFTFTSDGNHLTNFSSDVFYIAAFALSINDFKRKDKWIKIGEKLAIGIVVNRISHNIVYNIYKNK